jgi:type IV pilus assembly protein PilF
VKKNKINLHLCCALFATVGVLAGCAKDTSMSNTVADVDEVAAQKKNAKAAKINTQLGMGYLKQGNTSRAKQKLLMAQEQAPRSPDVAGALGYYFETTGEMNQAQRYYLRALNLAPGKGAQLNNYGAFLCRQAKYSEAEKYFIRATKDINYVNSAGAVENAGICALAIPNLALAKQYFEQAIAQDPQRFNSYYELGKMMLEAKQYKDSLKWIERYELQNNPLDPRMALLGFRAAEGAGLSKKADGFAWILKTKFPASKEFKQIASSEAYGKRYTHKG